VKKEAVNKKEAARYAKEQKKCKRDNMLEKPQVRILGHIKNARADKPRYQRF
jgi:hypothetical protein